MPSLSATKTAEVLKVSRQRVGILIQEGTLRARKDRWGRYLITEAEITRFQANRRPKTGGRPKLSP